MRIAGWFVVAVSWALALGAGVAQAKQEATPGTPAMDPAKQAAMEAMQKFGSPSQGHAAPEGREFKSMEIRHTRVQ